MHFSGQLGTNRSPVQTACQLRLHEETSSITLTVHLTDRLAPVSTNIGSLGFEQAAVSPRSIDPPHRTVCLPENMTLYVLAAIPFLMTMIIIICVRGPHLLPFLRRRSSAKSHGNTITLTCSQFITSWSKVRIRFLNPFIALCSRVLTWVCKDPCS